MPYIIKHRRKTTSEWDAVSRSILHEGEFAIEYNDDYTMARILIGGKNGVDALQFNPVSKIRSISLPVASWVEENGTWLQVVKIDGVTSNSKIDLQPNKELLAYLIDEEISLVAENNQGIVSIYALGYQPDRDIEIQVTIVETSL